MKYTKYKLITFLAFSVMLLGGCKKFLDVNQNPNIANDPGIENVLPAAQIEIAHVLGNLFQVNGSFWSQYWTQSPIANQYKQYDQYQPSSDNYNRPWATLYDGALSDLTYVYNTAKSKGNKNYMAIARLMSAYTYQMATDAWGDIPYSEALKGLEENGGIVSPKYDAQSLVYEGIVLQIDEAISLIDETSDAHPGADDLIYGGDMSNWLKFAHTLKLRVAMRMSEVSPTRSTAIIASIEADPTFSGFISSASDEASIHFTTAGGNENPVYTEQAALNTNRNIIASKTCVDSMNANFDPRVFVFYTPLANTTVVGNLQGDYSNSTAASGKSFGGTAVGINPDDKNSAAAPVRFLSSYESLLLQAEANLRGWLTSGDNDSTLYSSAIDASFDAYGITDATEISYYKDSTYWGVYPSTGTFNDKIRHIITQKWFAMCGNQGFEAWSEQRRTGYPDFLITSVNSLIGSKKPARFLYPTTEINLNANFPGTKTVDQRVWWDIN